MRRHRRSPLMPALAERAGFAQIQILTFHVHTWSGRLEHIIFLVLLELSWYTTSQQQCLSTMDQFKKSELRESNVNVTLKIGSHLNPHHSGKA